MVVLFIAAFGPIITDIDKSKDFYSKLLGLPLKEETNHYFHTESVDGAKHFALLPLAQVAQVCFQSDNWPDDIPVPTSWIEYDVQDINAASKELEEAGYRLLVNAQPVWGQTVTWLLSPENILTKLATTPFQS